MIKGEEDNMTHFYNNDTYDITGNYEIIGKAKIEYNNNIDIDQDWRLNWDLLILHNLDNYQIEVKYCRKKGLSVRY